MEFDSANDNLQERDIASARKKLNTVCVWPMLSFSSVRAEIRFL